MHWDHPPPDLGPPIDVPMEPILLDESDKAFFEIEAGSTHVSEEGLNESSRTVGDELKIRRLRKAYLYSGAWIALPVFAFLIVTVTIVALVLRRWEVMLIFLFTIVPFLLIVSLPLFFGRPVGPAWLVVPGGLIMRKAKRRGFASDVHLFHPDQTILMIRPLNKRIWIIHTEDKKEFGTFTLSDRELTMLLRAWRSPLQPPSPEKLIDLT